MKICPVCNRKYPDSMTLCSAEAAVLQRLEDPLLGQTLAGKYKIEKLIKQGGMGAVYRGKHVLMDKTVAIKVLKPSLAGDDAVVARFSREAKAASKISHPHAVVVTDFGEAENGVVFLVMEYLDGRTLKEIIAADGPLQLERATNIVRQVAGALDAAHSQGVIHRDLKSENIMLVRHDGDEWAKVLDFGIAKILLPHDTGASDITHANLVVGTPQYMSPEQCSQSGALDARSDVYSLGVILYEMLVGRVPFAGESATVIMMRQVQDPAPSVLTARPELPKAVDGVISKALAKQPIDRYQSAGELSSDLMKAASLEAMSDPALRAVAAAQTVPNTPVGAVDDADEATLVRPRPEITTRRNVQPRAELTADRFNPWRVMIPAVIVLIAVFGVVFFLTRSNSSGTADQTQGQPGLQADPNSQPVQPSGTPTGEIENDVRPVTVPSPTPTASPSTRPTPSATEIPATVTGDFGNENTNRNSNRNANRSVQPTPDQSEPPPPPRPSPTIRSVPKQTPPEATASPPL
ncbi:MAG TPA: protein kinase [Pyrinomonadaceae bacterium]|nr:protein kinase [Pyrinomonadaceae bacterium]